MLKAKAKQVLLPLFVLVMILAVTGCGTVKSSSQNGPANQSSNQSSNQSASSSEPITLKLAYSLPETHHIGVGMTRFADEVKKKTNGRVTIQLFPNSQLYRDVDIPQAILNRSIELGNSPVPLWASLIPAMDFPDVPFLFPTVEVLRNSFDGGITDLLESEMEKQGVKVLIWGEYGSSGYSNSKRVIKQPEDFKGLKIRGRGKLSEETLKVLGATPSFISSAEQYEALQRGMVDGVSTGFTSMASRKLYEVQKYLLVSNDVWGIFPLVINLKVWNELPKDVQDVMLQAAQDTTQYIRGESVKADQKALEVLKANKMEVYTIKPEELPKWKQVTQPLWDKYAKDTGKVGQQIIDIAKKYQ